MPYPFDGVNPIYDANGVPTGLSGNNGIINLDNNPQFKVGQRIKRFTDLRNVTITNGTGMASQATIDMSSPFGSPALKLVMTADNVGIRYCEVRTQGMDVAKFDDHVTSEIWLDDPTKITQITTYLGNLNFAQVNTYVKIVSQGGDKVGARRIIEAGPMLTASSPTFIFGTSSLQDVKQRFSVLPGQTTTIWIRSFDIPSRQRPTILFTWDDDYANWLTIVKPYLDKAKIKATFAVNTADISAGTGGTHITEAGIKQLNDDGHNITSHNINNYKLQTLNATGNGEDNGTGISQPPAVYVGDNLTAKKVLQSLCGADPTGFIYHAWVQGGMDTAAADYMRSEGVDICRTTAPYGVNLYGFELGNNAYALRSVTLGWLGADSSTVLTPAQAKTYIDQCEKYGGLLIFMGHNTAATSTDSITIPEDTLAYIISLAAQRRDAGAVDILTARQLRDRLNALGLLNRPQVKKPPIRQIGRLSGANANTTSDQVVALDTGLWVVTQWRAAKGSISMTNAVGGIYTGTGKTGLTMVSSSQSYSALTGAATDVATLTPINPALVSGNAYLSLTTAQGSTSTFDLFAFGYPVIDSDILQIDASTGAQVFPLPAAAICNGVSLTMNKVDASANTVTIKANGSELIAGVNTKVLSTQYSGVTIQSDGIGWIVKGLF